MSCSAAVAFCNIPVQFPTAFGRQGLQVDTLTFAAPRVDFSAPHEFMHRFAGQPVLVREGFLPVGAANLLWLSRCSESGQTSNAPSV